MKLAASSAVEAALEIMEGKGSGDIPVASQLGSTLRGVQRFSDAEHSLPPAMGEGFVIADKGGGLYYLCLIPGPSAGLSLSSDVDR